MAFVTTKLEHIAEVLSFKELSGGIEADGAATLVIDVNSIDAIFELRDDRMKEFLFDAPNFPAIGISTQVDMEALGALGSGETAAMTLQTTMSLLGTDYPVPAEVLVTNTGDGLVVSSVKPVLLSVPILGLQDGVAKLGELAGGISISNAVPVSFTLRFN